MKNKKKGMTLVELIAAIAILSIISVLIFSLFGSSNKLFSRTHNQSKLQDEIRLIASVLEEDIRTGKDKDVTFTGDKITYPGSTSTESDVVIDIGLEAGITDTVEVIYAYKKGTEKYAYVLVGNPSELREVRKYRCDVIEERGKFSSNVKEISLDMTTKPYSLKIILEDSKGTQESMNSLVTPRNG